MAKSQALADAGVDAAAAKLKMQTEFGRAVNVSAIAGQDSSIPWPGAPKYGAKKKNGATPVGMTRI